MMYVVMQIVSEIFCTAWTAVSIVDREKGTRGPDLDMVLTLWLDDVQNNRHSVFIIISNDALVCVGSIACYESHALACNFRWVEAGQLIGWKPLELNAAKRLRSGILQRGVLDGGGPRQKLIGYMIIDLIHFLLIGVGRLEFCLVVRIRVARQIKLHASGGCRGLAGAISGLGIRLGFKVGAGLLL